ncbi:MAG TPA: c-type cytochrome [Gemmatimonadales bacterium]|nr:c-type cytochrome [Gemmatimonadales bacterium]
MTALPFRALVALTCVASASLSAQVQSKFPPDSFTNLKVLPKNIDQRTLIATMRGFAMALGVRCNYCHVGEEGAPLQTFNFASDDKRTKRTARVMMDMVHHINAEHLQEVPDRPQPVVEVRCETCHRGLSRPRLIQDVLDDAFAAGGVDSVTRAYRALRDRYYGTGSYDFSERVLNEMARGLQQKQKPDQALALLRLNAEFFPNSAMVYAGMGEALRQQGDTAGALTQFRHALAIDSTLGMARQRVSELTRH